MYKITHYPTKKTHGLKPLEIASIANELIEKVNKDNNADLKLNIKHYRDPWNHRGYLEQLEPWDDTQDIKIERGSFKLIIVKSPYAIREFLRRLQVKIVEV